MSSFVRSKTLALLVGLAIITSPSALAQSRQDAQQQTRPRRVQPLPAEPQPTPDAAWPNDDPPLFIGEVPPAPSLARLTSEPTVRIGLVSNARSVTISSGSKLVSWFEDGRKPTPLEVSRVRIEARNLPALPLDVPPHDGEAGAVQLAARSPAQVKRNTNDDAREAKSSSRTATKNTANQTSVRLASRASVPPARGMNFYASGTSPLMSAREPVMFSSDDEASAPVKFNEKAYRGRLEVFPNSRGLLTVVNVVNLEDYVRGVVPNELSPGGYPALEALKAQAVAARTYAVSHRGQFSSEGFDLLPSTRSQVYGGRQTEHPLSDRAVAETRGLIATYKGAPIDALYTSTCGGRTEDAENIFGKPVPYLRGRECAADGHAHVSFAPFVVRTTREPATLHEAAHATSARDAALLSTHGLRIPARITDEWLAAPVTVDDVRSWLAGVAILARQQALPAVGTDATRPPGFSTALSQAVYGESRGDVLLDKADVDYLLAFRDADEVPTQNRADVAMLLREGHLSLYPDATLRPRQPMTRARALRATTRLLETRDLFRIQNATARTSTGGALVVRQAAKGPEKSLNVSADAYLFRAFGGELYPAREAAIVGGEPVAFHLNARGEVDYLEVRPAPNGASSERSSPFTNWSVTLTPAEVASRLGRWAGRIGTLVDLRVVSRGVSRRVTDLEVRGTNATAHVTSGRIRSALGLREQLFVIDRRYDDAGRITAFVFTGRGWGHGVGMCQVGAYGLARAGLNYEKILKTYYTGINLTKLY